MAGKKKQPELRFKGFSGDWEERVLGELAEAFEYGLNAAAIEYDGVNKYIRITDIDDETHVFKTDALTSPGTDLNFADNYKLKKGDLLFARTGASVGKTYHYKIADGLVYFAGFLIRARIRSEFDVEFVFQNTLTNDYDNFIRLTSQRSGQPGVNAQEYSCFEILIPELSEQKEIGMFFSNLDNLITLQQRKLDKLINIKKALLEKMFPKNGAVVPEIRFKGFSEDWEQRKLVDEAELFSGLTYSPNNVVKKNGTFVLRSSNVKNGEVVNADNVYVDSRIVNSCNVKEGDIIVVVRNGSRSLIGKHAQIKVEMKNTVIGAFMTGLRSDQPEFVNALLNTHAFDNEVEKNLGATINQITNGSFQDMKFMFPKSQEKKLIGETFFHLDNLITLQKRRLEKLKNIKKACLEKMFV